MTVNPNIPLELLNGGGMVLAVFFLSWMAVYLFKESVRRKLGVRDWLGRLPPSMHLAVAIFVFDLGVVVFLAVVWWRVFYAAADFSETQIVLLALGAVTIIVGALCKIRAITKPDHGNWPWLMALAALAVFLGAMLLFP